MAALSRDRSFQSKAEQMASPAATAQGIQANVKAGRRTVSVAGTLAPDMLKDGLPDHLRRLVLRNGRCQEGGGAFELGHQQREVRVHREFAFERCEFIALKRAEDIKRCQLLSFLRTHA